MTNKQTNKRTNADENITSLLLSGSNNRVTMTADTNTLPVPIAHAIDWSVAAVFYTGFGISTVSCSRNSDSDRHVFGLSVRPSVRPYFWICNCVHGNSRMMA